MSNDMKAQLKQWTAVFSFFFFHLFFLLIWYLIDMTTITTMTTTTTSTRTTTMTISTTTQHKHNNNDNVYPPTTGGFSVSFFFFSFFHNLIVSNCLSQTATAMMMRATMITSTSATMSAHSVINWNRFMVSNPLQRGSFFLVFIFSNHFCLIFSTTTRSSIFSSSFAMSAHSIIDWNGFMMSNSLQRGLFPI